MGVLGKALGLISGEGRELKVSENILFDKVIGFRGINEGVGASTLVQNVAIAIGSKTSMSVGVIDVAFMFPAQYRLLTNAHTRDKEDVKDIVDYDDDIAEIMYTSKYRNVKVTGYKDRTIVDMVSSRDNGENIVKIIEGMKNFFDIILIDLGSEYTQSFAEAAIKCNKIYTVADPSMKCMSNINKSINTNASLAIPFYKCRKCILNKEVASINAGTMDALKNLSFEVLGVIPLSEEISKAGTTGNKLWGAVSNGAEVTEFNKVIDIIVDDILNKGVNAREVSTPNKEIVL